MTTKATSIIAALLLMILVTILLFSGLFPMFEKKVEIFFDQPMDVVYTKTWAWIGTNFILALFPVWASYLIAFLFGLNVAWHSHLKNGELYIFSVALACTSLFNIMQIPSPRPEYASLHGFIFIFVIFLSTLSYSVRQFISLMSHTSQSNWSLTGTEIIRNMNSTNTFSLVSVSISVVTILFGYFSYMFAL